MHNTTDNCIYVHTQHYTHSSSNNITKYYANCPVHVDTITTTSSTPHVDALRIPYPPRHSQD